MSIIVENLSYTYMPKTPYEKKALDNLSFQIREGEYVGIIGATGSGKSTLVQHLNGLIKLTEGRISVFGMELDKKSKPDYKKLRSTVGMVFQYPEYQLFFFFLEKDVAFGPKNIGLSAEETAERVREAVGLVGLDYDEVAGRSPFELSGGQKRRVAIAGVIAMRPKVLVLDEPTAGLDPAGRNDMYRLIDKIKAESTPTVIMISHNMDEISRHADRILVLNEGRKEFFLPPAELFANSARLSQIGLDIPLPVKVAGELRSRGYDVSQDVVTPDDLTAEIRRLAGR